jgi:Winged helix DNA-binding domain
MAGMRVTRSQVLRFRWRGQQLDAAAGTVGPDAPDVLDLGAQDSGTGGALWALANRGARVAEGAWPEELALVWSVRGAPHAYRRRDLPDVEAALRPFSPADAAKRIYDAAKPLKAAGIPADQALAEVATRIRRIVTEPTVKGVVSTRLTQAMSEPYLRWCRPCGATHLYEMPFRLGARHAGLELEPGTSPPVLSRVPHWPAGQLGSVAPVLGYPERLDPVRGYLHLLGPARPAEVAGYLDAPVRDVARRWPVDVVEVDVDGEPRSLLAADADRLADAARAPDRPAVRLLGPFDLFLQARDRELLVPDAARRPGLWPVLGRPGAVVADGEIVGTWRPRASGSALRMQLDAWVPWEPDLEALVEEQAVRLAEHRGMTFAGPEPAR